MTPFCLAAYDAEWSKRNKRGMMPNNMIEKIREEDRKKRAQGYPGRIGDIRFTNEGSVRLPSGLRLSGEGPLFLPTLNLNLHHGLVRVKRSQAESPPLHQNVLLKDTFPRTPIYMFRLFLCPDKF